MRELFLGETNIFRPLVLYFEKTLAKYSELQHQQLRGPCVISHTHAPSHIHDHPSHSNTQHFTGWPEAHLQKLRLSIDFVSSPNSFM